MPDQEHVLRRDVAGEELFVDPEPALSEPVRQRVIALAAAAHDGHARGRVAGDASQGRPVRPKPPRQARRDRDRRPARRLIRCSGSGSAPASLETAGELGAAVRDGSPPAAADPVEVAALAYLVRPARWLDLLATAAETLKGDARSAAATERLAAAEHRAMRAEHERAVAKIEAEKLRDELTRLRAEADGLRDEVRTLTRTLREAQAKERKAADMLATEKGRAAPGNGGVRGRAAPAAIQADRRRICRQRRSGPGQGGAGG